jgi:hypothetical protein
MQSQHLFCILILNEAHEAYTMIITIFRALNRVINK